MLRSIKNRKTIKEELQEQVSDIGLERVLFSQVYM